MTPGVLTLGSNPTTSGIALQWTAATGATGTVHYQVQRAPDVTGAPGTFANVGSSQTTLTLVDTTAVGDLTKYWYRVVCTDDVGNASTLGVFARFYNADSDTPPAVSASLTTTLGTPITTVSQHFSGANSYSTGSIGGTVKSQLNLGVGDHYMQAKFMLKSGGTGLLILMMRADLSNANFVYCYAVNTGGVHFGVAVASVGSEPVVRSNVAMPQDVWHTLHFWSVGGAYNIAVQLSDGNWADSSGGSQSTLFKLLDGYSDGSTGSVSSSNSYAGMQIYADTSAQFFDDVVFAITNATIADNAKPTNVSVAVNRSTVTWTLSDQSSPITGAGTLTLAMSGGTTTATGFVWSGLVGTATAAREIINGETGTASYDGLGTLADSASVPNTLDSFSGATVTNNSPIVTPHSLSVIRRGSTWISFQWVNPDVGGYDTIQARINGGTPVNVGTISGIIAYRFLDLTPGTSYSIQVRGVLDGTPNAWSTALATSTRAVVSRTANTPGALWNGTALSGGTPPSDPVRTTFKPNVRCDLMAYQRIAAGSSILCTVIPIDPLGATVTHWCEGRTQTSSTWEYNEDTGRTGIVFKIGGVAGHSGLVANYFSVVPNTPGSQTRVIGPIYHINYDASNPGAVPAETNWSIHPDTGFDTTGTGTDLAPFKTPKGAIDKIIGTGVSDISGVHLRIMGPHTGDLRAECLPTVSFTNSYDHVVIEPHPSYPGAIINKPGLEVNYGPDKLRIRRMTYQGQGSDTGYWNVGGNGVQNIMFWDDGCVFLGKGPSTDQVGGGGSGYQFGWNSLYRTFCYITGTNWLILVASECNENIMSNCSGGISHTSQMGVWAAPVSQTGQQHYDTWQLENTAAENVGYVDAFVQADGSPPTHLRFVSYTIDQEVRDCAALNCVFLGVQQNSNMDQIFKHFAFYHVTHSPTVAFGPASTQKEIVISGGTAVSEFKVNNSVTSSSGGFGIVVRGDYGANSNKIYIGDVSGTFNVSDTITGIGFATATPGTPITVTATVASPPTFVSSDATSEFKGCLIYAMDANYFAGVGTGTIPRIESTFNFDYNNYITGSWTPGTNVTTVASPTAADNFTPNGSTPTMPRMAGFPFDLFGNARAAITALGALAFAAEYAPVGGGSGGGDSGIGVGLLGYI
jgi:hypothetical protein